MINKNLVSANYNMEFNQGTFKKNNIYNYRYDKDKIFVTTEEKKEQDFTAAEFDILFNFLGEEAADM